jgi:hypothetical protein
VGTIHLSLGLGEQHYFSVNGATIFEPILELAAETGERTGSILAAFLEASIVDYFTTSTRYRLMA